MVKVLIYSSKEIYDNAPFEGRAEAHLIAYREDEEYVILKNKTNKYIAGSVSHFRLRHFIEWAERDEWDMDMKSYKLKESYRDHPITTLMKNEPADV